MKIGYTRLVEVDPNPKCILCDEPVFSSSDNIGFAVAGLVCCVDCYDGPPMWPNLTEDA